MIQRTTTTALGAILAVVLLLPLVGLIGGASPAEMWAALQAPSTRSALWVSLRTTAVSLLVVVGLGTPLAWRLSRGGHGVGAVLAMVELPIVLPPAVLGIALLETFGRAGLFGPSLAALGIQLPFSMGAVVLAQILVGAPLFVSTATAAFRAVDDDLLLVARTLGAGPSRAWLSVAVPVALPGLLSGAALAWARALGEFGATLMFAGNLEGRTQTLPLLVYESMESDMGVARAISVVMVGVAVAVLAGLGVLARFGPGGASGR
jgi:molybdate transport system permease protein